MENKISNNPILEKTIDLINIVMDNDGSVITLLESIFDEEISIENVNQRYYKVNSNEWSDVEENELILMRNVFLSGKESNEKYSYATSLIRTKYLPKSIVRELEKGEFGIGKIIKENKIETYREIVEQKTSDSCLLQSMFSTKGIVSSRVYKIYFQGTPVMLITEYYPNDIYSV